MLTERKDIIAADIMLEDGVHQDYTALDLCSVIMYGSKGLLERVVKSNPKALEQNGPTGEPPLSYAIGLGKIDQAIILADYFQEIDERERYGHTPVQYIAKYAYRNAMTPGVAVDLKDLTSKSEDDMSIASEKF